VSKSDRYQLTQYSGTIGGPLAIASSDQPKNVYEAGKHLRREGAKDVRIYDLVAGKDYDLDAFGKEHRLK